MTLLLIDSEVELVGKVVDHFRADGRRVDAVLDGESALSLCTFVNYDLIVCARDLRGMSGLEVMRRLRSKGLLAPILLLGAKGRDWLQHPGFNEQTDHYLLKPIAAAELIPRISTILAQREASEILIAGPVALDLRKQRAMRAGRSIALSPVEFALLKYLALHSDQLVTRRMLLENVWNMNFDPHTSLIESHMSRLRSKVNQGFPEDLIHTIRGRGYRLVSHP